MERIIGPTHEQGFSNHGRPIPNNEGYGLTISIYLSKVWETGERNYKISPPFAEPMRSEVYRFWLALLAYYESPNPVLPFNKLMSIVRMEYDGIVWLKKVRSYSFQFSYDTYPIEYNEEDRIYIEEAKQYPLVDIGDFFNVRYWLFFDQPDPEDWKNCFIPLPEISQDLIDEFRFAVSTVLPEDVIEVIEEEEILLQISGSSALSKEGKTFPNWQLKESDNFFGSTPLEGRGSYVQKCPGDTRFTFTLPVYQSNSVKLIEKQTARIASKMEWSAYGLSDEEFGDKYNKFKHRSNHFYCRDFKKDGLTKNRKLVQIVCQELKKKYPDLPAWKYIGIFDNFYLTVDGVKYNPPRGVGLGMSAAITTIIQCAISYMLFNRLYSLDGSLGTSYDALIYHDDIAFGSYNEDQIEDLVSTDYKLCTSLGCVPVLSKSFSGTTFVLCENYSDPILDKKESYQRTVLKMIHASVNITHAKFQWFSQLRLVEPVLWKEYAQELVAHFGYEFYSDESLYPSLLGGWIPMTYKGLDITFAQTDSYNQGQIAASLVGLPQVRLPVKKKIKNNRLYKPPIKRIYPTVKEFGKSKSYHANSTLEDVQQHFLRVGQSGLTQLYWEKVKNKRLAIFNSEMKKDYTLREWYSRIREVHPMIDIYPPEGLRTFVECNDKDIVDFLYKPTNPLLQHLKFLNPGALSDKIIPWPLPPEVRIDSSVRPTNDERNQIRELNFTFPYTNAGILEVEEMDRLYCINNSEWFNINNVIEFTHTMTLEYKYPRVGDHPTLAIRNSDYGLYNKLSHNPYGKVFSYLCEKLGVTIMNDLPVTEIGQEVIKLIELRKQLTVKQDFLLLQTLLKSTIGSWEDSGISTDSNFVWTDRSLHDEDFFTWRTGRKNHRNWRNAIFLMIDEKVTTLEVQEAGTLNKRAELSDEDKMLIALDPAELHLYKKSGGIVDSDNIPILYRPDHEDEPDDDIFKKEGSSQSSEGGLFCGF